MARGERAGKFTDPGGGTRAARRSVGPLDGHEQPAAAENAGIPAGFGNNEGKAARAGGNSRACPVPGAETGGHLVLAEHVLQVASTGNNDPVTSEHECAIDAGELTDGMPGRRAQHASLFLRVTREWVDDDLVRALEDPVVVAQGEQEPNRLSLLAFP